MSSAYRPTEQEIKLILDIIGKLHRCTDSRDLRQSIADDLLRLTEADMLASFVWNESLQRFEDAVFVNMTVTNLERYSQHFQYHDPITPLLHIRKNASLVIQVMPQKELEKTEFFNDFLQIDGLTHGINLYAYDGGMNVGDLRIWRGAKRMPFSERELVLLEMLRPHFTSALINTRIMTDLRKRASGWQDFWELHPAPCLVFDAKGRELHQNAAARQLKLEVLPEEWKSLHAQVHRFFHTQMDNCFWRNYRLVFTKTGANDADGAPLFMVQLTERTKFVIDQDYISNRFKITPAEANICLWVMRGFSDQAIADRCFRSVWTVRGHVKSIFDKLKVSGRQELTHLITSAFVDIQQVRPDQKSHLSTSRSLNVHCSSAERLLSQDHQRLPAQNDHRHAV